MRFRSVIWLLTVPSLVLVTAVPAAADTVSFADSRGDAPARFDLTRTSITNEAERIVVAQKVRDLRGDRTQIYGFNVFTGDGQYIVHAVRRKNGETSTRLHGPDGEVGCDIRSRWRLDRNLIRLSMSRGCIARDGAFRARTMIGAGDGSSGDPVDWTKRVLVGQD